MNKVPMTYPSDWNDFPPAWMKPDVRHVLGLAASGVLWTAVSNLDFGWTRTEDARPCVPITDDQSSTAAILVERGYLCFGDRVTLIKECGETFTAEVVALTTTGRALYYRLNHGK